MASWSWILLSQETTFLVLRHDQTKTNDFDPNEKHCVAVLFLDLKLEWLVPLSLHPFRSHLFSHWLLAKQTSSSLKNLVVVACWYRSIHFPVLSYERKRFSSHWIPAHFWPSRLRPTKNGASYYRHYLEIQLASLYLEWALWATRNTALAPFCRFPSYLYFSN